MTVELRGVSTASLGGMLKGYGVMAAVGARWPGARFWWTPSGAVVVEVPDPEVATDEEQRVRVAIESLIDWADATAKTFAKADGSEPPLKNPAIWKALDSALALDAEGVGIIVGRQPWPNPLLGSWGQAIGGRANLFNTLAEAARDAKNKSASEADIDAAVFDEALVAGRRLKRGGGVLFPDGIKRYATGADWIHENKKPLGNWDYILAMRGLLLLRGAPRTPRGSKKSYPAFPFVVPGSVVRAQGSTVATQEVFLPTWSCEHPRTLAEFQAQVRGFQARVGRRDFASGAADFRRAIAGRAVTGAFDAFHRFALEPRKPGRSPQTQAVARGITIVGPASAARGSLRLLLAPLDDSGWLDMFRLRWTGGKVDENSERLALVKTRFDEAVHAAIDVATGASHVAVLKALWDLQLTLWRVSKRPASQAEFRPAPLLEGDAWRRVLAEHLENSSTARLGWALASVGWVPVPDSTGQEIKRPIVEQILPVVYEGQRGLRVPDIPPAERVPQPGHNPTREMSALFWRRWLDTAGLPVSPTRGTRAADAADVAALLWGDLAVKEVQQYFLAFAVLDGTGGPPPSASVVRPPIPAYAALRLWLELSAKPPPGQRRPLDRSVPRAIATGTATSVANACRIALRRLHIAGLPGSWLDDARPRGRSVALPGVGVSAFQAPMMAAALMIPVRDRSIAELAATLMVPSPRTETEARNMETAHA